MYKVGKISNQIFVSFASCVYFLIDLALLCCSNKCDRTSLLRLFIPQLTTLLMMKCETNFQHGWSFENQEKMLSLLQLLVRSMVIEFTLNWPQLILFTCAVVIAPPQHIGKNYLNFSVVNAWPSLFRKLPTWSDLQLR